MDPVLMKTAPVLSFFEIAGIFYERKEQNFIK